MELNEQCCRLIRLDCLYSINHTTGF